ncbi:MAG: acyl-CoA thioesterase [Roseiarcus sp.]
MFVNRRQVRIEWGDCDAAGIVFYPRYFALFDASTHALFEAAGWKKADLRREFDMVGFPMVDTRARFLIASSYGDDIVIETKIAAIRNSSFDIEHKVFRHFPEGERLAIEAWETRVWTGRHPDDPTRLKARPIPEAIVERLTQ